ncbi:MAG TPA: hypothetical protein VG938_06780 [Verrucomicrobiae bacterium]|nr:hypothetical protein [Verrucomicrobiae bacterium]
MKNIIYISQGHLPFDILAFHMSVLRVAMPPNDGLKTTAGELFKPDPNFMAEIRFKVVVGDGVECSATEHVIEIKHIITDIQGRRFVFTSLVPPYFFWEQMYVAKNVGSTPDYVENGILLDAYAHRRNVLVENLQFYFDGRHRRALQCFFPEGVKTFSIYEKHISPSLNLIAIEWEGEKMRTSLIVEFQGMFLGLETEYGRNKGDKFCYAINPRHFLWRHFEEPTVVKCGPIKYGSIDTGPTEYIEFLPVSPFRPVLFEPYLEDGQAAT